MQRSCVSDVPETLQVDVETLEIRGFYHVSKHRASGLPVWKHREHSYYFSRGHGGRWLIGSKAAKDSGFRSVSGSVAGAACNEFGPSARGRRAGARACVWAGRSTR